MRRPIVLTPFAEEIVEPLNLTLSPFGRGEGIKKTCAGLLQRARPSFRFFFAWFASFAVQSKRLRRDVAAEVRAFKLDALHGGVGGGLGGA